MTGILRPVLGVISTETHESLLLANVPSDKAKAAAGEIAKTQDFATKSDLLELQSKMDTRFADLEQSLAVLKFAIFSVGPIILALLVKLVFFP